MWFLLIIFLLQPAIKYRTWLEIFNTRGRAEFMNELKFMDEVTTAGCDFFTPSQFIGLSKNLSSIEITRKSTLWSLSYSSHRADLATSPLLSRVTKFTQLRLFITFINISFSRPTRWNRERILINLSCLEGTWKCFWNHFSTFCSSRLSSVLIIMLDNLRSLECHCHSKVSRWNFGYLVGEEIERFGKEMESRFI